MNSTAVRYKLISRLVYTGHVVERKDNVIRQFSEQNCAELVERRVQGKVTLPIQILH